MEQNMATKAFNLYGSQIVGNRYMTARSS